MESVQIQLSHPKYRSDIDGLRAIAVLSVVIFHAFPASLKGGFIGVDIFFVISGFLISTIIFENLKTGTFSFAEFYTRRIKRIFPALILVLLASYAFGSFALLPDEYKQLGKHIAAGAGFVSNIVLWGEAGYFDKVAESKPLLHLWSLGIEEQFYIVWPLLLWLAYRINFNLLLLTLLLGMASFTFNVFEIHLDPVADFYSPQTRFWELLCGSLLAWMALTSTHQHINRSADNIFSCVGLVLLVCGFCTLDKTFGYPGLCAIIPVLGAVLIIFAGASAWINRVVLSNHFAIWFGLISYPLYLWHWPLLSFARIIQGEEPTWAIRLAAVLLAVVLAWLTARIVEKPVRSAKHGKIKVIVLVLLMLIVGFMGYDAYLRDGLVFKTKQFDKNMDQGIYLFSNTALCRKNHPYANFPAACFESEQKYPESVYLIGDSHMEALTYGFRKLFDDGAFKYNITAIGHVACSPLLNVESRWANGTGGDFGCKSVINQALNEAMSRPDVKWVVLVGRHASGVNGTGFGEPVEKSWRFRYEGNTESSDNPTEAFDLGLIETFDRLTKSGKKVVFVHQVPELGFNPRICLTTLPQFFSHRECFIARSVVDARLTPYKSVVRRVMSSYPDVVEYDPINLFCNNESCGIFNHFGELMYFDDDHMSKIASEYIAKEIYSRMGSN